MDDASFPPQHIVDGRLVVDKLPAHVALLPGEVELVAYHLLDALDPLFSRERPSSDTPGILEREKAVFRDRARVVDDESDGSP